MVLKKLSLITITILSLQSIGTYGGEDRSYAVIRPAISPNGRTIAFCYRTGDQTNIFTYDRGSSRLAELTKAGKNINNYDPAFSPDGKMIVYGRMDKSRSQIYVIHADGSNGRRLTNNKYNDEGPIFSADGKRIVFARAKTYRSTSTYGSRWDDWDLYSINSDGTSEVRITQATFYELCCLSYIQQQDNIIFGAISSSYPPTTGVYAVDAGGKEKELVITSESGMTNPEPAISPDGKIIAFVARGTIQGFQGEFQLFTMNINGQDLKQVTRNRSRNFYPVFWPDGKQILFVSCAGSGDECDLKRVNIDGSGEELVAPF